LCRQQKSVDDEKSIKFNLTDYCHTTSNLKNMDKGELVDDSGNSKGIVYLKVDKTSSHLDKLIELNQKKIELLRYQQDNPGLWKIRDLLLLDYHMTSDNKKPHWSKDILVSDLMTLAQNGLIKIKQSYLSRFYDIFSFKPRFGFKYKY
jgi:hypothetical protein